MKRIALLAGLLLVLGASAASAAGVNLSWTDCGTFGTQNMTFACNANAGLAGSAVGSFIPPANINQFVGISAQLDVTTDQATLPDWWGDNATGCRGAAGVSPNFDFTANINCIDPYAGSAAGALAYDIGFTTPNRARCIIQCAIPTEEPLDAATEYYGFKFNISRTKTTGLGSCAGCQFPACLVLNSFQLFQNPVAGNDPVIVNAINRNFVTWQSAPNTIPPCPQSTPTRRDTWGRVKSLYR